MYKKKIFLWVFLIFIVIFTISTNSVMANPGVIDNILGYWKHDASSTPQGISIDAVGLNNGFLNSLTANITGKINEAYNLSGATTSFVNFSDAPQFDEYITKNFTMNCWVHLENVGTNKVIFGKDNNLIRSWIVYITDAGAVRYASNPAVEDDLVVPNGNVIFGQWNMITVKRWANTTCVGYVNGTALGSAACTNDIVDTTTPFHIGISGNFGAGSEYPLKGAIDECSMWNDTKSNSEISDLWNNDTGSQYPFVESKIVEVNIIPQNPFESDNLNCVFNISGIENNTINATVSWYNSTDNSTWVHITDYDYTYINITQNLLYTTNVGNGSVVAPISSSTYWICNINATDNSTTNLENSTSILILANLPPYFSNALNISSGTFGFGENFTSLISINIGTSNLSYYRFATNITGTWTNDTAIIADTVSTCYQEFTNVSTTCGGLSNGTYFKDADVDNYNFADGEWSTLSQASSQGTFYTYSNYSKSELFLGAINQIKYRTLNVDYNVTCYNGTTWINDTFADTAGSAIIVNYTIPDACFNQDPIQIRYDVFSAISGDYKFLYEEGMFWNITTGFRVSTTKKINIFGRPQVCWKYWANDTQQVSNESNEYCFNVGNTAPIVNIIYPENNSYTSSKFPFVNISIYDLNEDSQTCDLYFNGTIYNTSSITIEECFQNLPNESTSCGGLSTGNLSQTGTWDSTGNAFDGNWTSRDKVTGLQNGFIYVNYSKVSNSTSSSKWEVRVGNTNNGVDTSWETFNWTINQTCWDYDANKIMLYVDVFSSDAFSSWAQPYCYNGTWVKMDGVQLYDSLTGYFYEQGMWWNFNGSSSISMQVNTSLFDGQYNVWATCNDSIDLGTSQNNTLTIQTQFVNTLNITPNNPLFNQNLNCQFNISSFDPAWELDTNITWYNSTDAVTWNSVTDFDVSYNNVTHNSVIVTTSGNGSVNYTLTEYTYWKCQLSIDNNLGVVDYQNSSEVRIVPQGVLAIVGAANNTESNQQLNSTFNFIYEGSGGECGLNVNGSQVAYNNSVVNITNTSLFYLPGFDSLYSWYVFCANAGNLEFVNSSLRYFYYDSTGPNMTNYFNDTSSTYPEIGDVVNLNVTVNDWRTIDSCTLQINDNTTWWNSSTYLINSTGAYNLGMTFVVRDISVSNNSNVSWRAQCNDTAGNYNTSIANNFTVIDTTIPNITLGNNNSFDLSNRSIITSALYNLTLNVNFSDHNLFQAEINITCDENGTIHYWNVLDFNNTGYIYNAVVPLTGMQLQKCSFLISASDDHTDKKIKKYKVIKINNGVKFKTDRNINVTIKLKTNTKNKKPLWGYTDIDDVNTKKYNDRYTIDFEFDEKKKERVFILTSNYKIYYQKDSRYPAHFVIWNEELKSGNWVDFYEPNFIDPKYTIKKISDFEYEIKIRTTNKLDEYNFKSIGGTNILNVTGDFYIGSAVNVSGNNIYDNTSISNWNVSVSTLNSFPGWNGSANVPDTWDWLVNLSNGTYLLDFEHACFFPQTEILNISNVSQNVTWNSYESEWFVQVANVATGAFLEGWNLTLQNYDSGQWHNYTNVSSVGISSLILNATTYNLTISAEGYDVYNINKTFNCKENLTETISLSFLATFFLYDENTLDIFNVSSPDTIYFILMCPNSTSTSIITTNVTTIPITCDYDKFRFIMDYGTSSYYRTFILEPDDALSVDIFLIDALTTTYISNNFIVDDLVDDYDDIRVYVYKMIGDVKTQITADWTDIESKITAYLIQNHEYIVEIVSNNNPTRVMGDYVAAESGDKALKLYDIGIDSSSDSFSSNVQISMGSNDLTNMTTNSTDLWAVLYAFGYDYEGSPTHNLTSVQYELFTDSCQGTSVYNWSTSDVTTLQNGIQLFTNITEYKNQTVCSAVNLTYAQADGTENSETRNKIIHTYELIQQEIFEYVTHNWMNWFLLILLGSIAMLGTVKFSKYTALAVSIGAGLLTAFGWLFRNNDASVMAGAIAVIAVCVFLAFVSILKAGDANV